MGWCSATEIMDAAIRAAELAVGSALVKSLRVEHQCCSSVAAAWEKFLADPKDVTVRSEVASYVSLMDEAIRPIVKQLSEKLRAEDWDCAQDSAYFWRFPQEMLGYSDRQFRDFLSQRMPRETDPELVGIMSAHFVVVTERMHSNGG